MLVLLFFALGYPVLGQQAGTTQTTCQASGNQVNCSSEHVPSPDEVYDKYRHLFDVGRRDSGQPTAAAANSGAPLLSDQAIKELLAEERQEQENKDTVDFIYCRRNPNGRVADFDGKTQTCADVVEYTRAFCLVNPQVDRCTLARSKREVEKAFADAIKGFNDDPRHTKKDTQGFYDEYFAKLTRWRCMSFPDMVLPERDGTFHECPDAPPPSDPAPAKK